MKYFLDVREDDIVSSIRLLSLIYGGRVAWIVSIANESGKTVWRDTFPQPPTFDEVRHALAKRRHGREISAWRIFRDFQDTWRPMNPAATEVVFGNKHGSILVTKYYL